MEPVTIGAIILVLWLMIWDIAYRRAPNWLTLSWLMLGIIVNWPGGAITATFVWLIMDYSQFPAGDCKGAAAIAAWVPWMIFLPAFAAMFVVTLILMETGWYKLYQRAHRWAWLAGLGFALTITIICRTLIGT